MGCCIVSTVHAKNQCTLNCRVEHLLPLAYVVLCKKVHGVEKLSLHHVGSLVALILKLLFSPLAQGISGGRWTKLTTDELDDGLEVSGVLFLPIPTSREQDGVAGVEIEIVQVN